MPSRRALDPDPIASAPLSESLRALARQGVMRQLRKGTEIISEGDVSDTLYIVLSGSLRAYSMGADEREVTYSTYVAGEYVGEMGLDGGPRSANVQALEPTLCVVVTRPTLERHLAADPAFAFELLAKVIRLARAATMSLRRIALNNVYGRVKDLLEGIAVPQPDGTWVADPAPTHQSMAHSLGCGREMVSRVMKELENGGLVEVHTKYVRIKKKLPAKW